MALKILFIGDVVGSPGRKIVSQALPRLIPRWGIGLVVCNAENSAGGSGLTLRCFEELAEAGVDIMTMGDHVYRKDEIFSIFERSDTVVRPANFPTESPGAELALAQARDGTLVAVFTVLGRTFMKPVDSPFTAADRLLERIGGTARVILVDVHAEATSDKQLLGRYLDGRVTAVLGTHTHVATADEQILKQGTAFQCDVGMTGPHDSILGRRYDRVLSATLSHVPCFFDVATGDPRLNGALVTADPATGRALSIQRVSLSQPDVQKLLTDSAAESPAPSSRASRFDDNPLTVEEAMDPDINIYCDESAHLIHDGLRAMVLGAVWCPADKSREISFRLRETKIKHGFASDFELKWTKASPSKVGYYLDVVDYFFDDDDLHFRGILIPDKSILDHAIYAQSHDDWYYKMCFRMLEPIIDPTRSHAVYLDIKDTKSEIKRAKLERVLRSSRRDRSGNIIRRVQQIRSHESELMQVADLLIGAVGHTNRFQGTSQAKREIILRIQKRCGKRLDQSTWLRESKFNLFRWSGGSHEQG